MYTKLYSTWNDTVIDTSNPDDLYLGGFRESNKQVYFIPREDSVEYTLYDFTKQVGDTMLVGYGYEHVIDSIDSVIAGTGYRKRYQFSEITTLRALEVQEDCCIPWTVGQLD